MTRDPQQLPRVVIDFETRSELDLRDVGAWRYAEHPSTEIICLGYKLPGESTRMWAPPLALPEDLVEAAGDENLVFEAHNAQFEIAIWRRILHEQMGAPMPRRWFDTMAVCAYRAIPLGLDEAGRVLGLETQKDKRGKEILQKLSKPRRPLKKEREAFAEQGLEPEEYPTLWRQDWQLLEDCYDYCERDVDTEELLGETLGDLPPSEYRLWVMDQAINMRGVYVDSEAVDAAIEVVEALSEDLEAELREITDGAVQTGSQVAKIVAWLNEVGVPVENLQAETVEEWIERIDDEMSANAFDPAAIETLEAARRVLEIRQVLGSSSVKKLYKFDSCRCEDGRIRGLLQYHGAGTGRWSGRLVQPQNFPRGSLEDFCDRLGAGPDEVMETLVDVIKLGGREAADTLEDMFGSVIEALTTSLRGLFTAAPGNVYHVADFSAIEAVVTSWLAGEEWKLEAFRAIQRGELYNGAPDIYCATASSILGRPITKKENPKERQQFGKVPELAFGYQGGEGAWYNFDPKTDLSSEEINGIKDSWREKHPATVDLWYGLENAAIDALQLQRPVRYRGVVFEPVSDSAGDWLAAKLPSSRRIWYYNPALEDVKMPWGKWKKQVSYEGRDNKKGGKWGRIRTYGGMLTENVVQAIARDLMAEAMVRVWKAGYGIVLTVHDEIVSEDPEDFGSQEEFEALMSEVPAWAEGCPVGVAGWQGRRYKKD